MNNKSHIARTPCARDYTPSSYTFDGEIMGNLQCIAEAYVHSIQSIILPLTVQVSENTIWVGNFAPGRLYNVKAGGGIALEKQS